MSVYVTDTHPLVWYAVGQHGKLSLRVLNVFEMAWRDQVMIHVPPVVIWEISMLINCGKVKLRDPLGTWCQQLFKKPCFDLAPFDDDVICIAHHLQFTNDLFDGLIVATARHMDLPLITKDLNITDSGLVEIMW
jgi:PIN domain nuclease of toxin-antitoxin system